MPDNAADPEGVVQGEQDQVDAGWHQPAVLRYILEGEVPQLGEPAHVASVGVGHIVVLMLKNSFYIGFIGPQGEGWRG